VSKGQPILPVLLILGKQSVLTFCSLEAANVIEVTGSSKTKDLRKTFIPIADYIAQYEGNGPSDPIGGGDNNGDDDQPIVNP